MTAFADLEAELTAVSFAELANATADFGGGKIVEGIFDAAYRDAFNAVAGSLPVFSAPASALSGVVSGASVSINGTAWLVDEVQPDGRGSVMLILGKP